jgi:hypothetical protein
MMSSSLIAVCPPAGLAVLLLSPGLRLSLVKRAIVTLLDSPVDREHQAFRRG